MIQTITCKAENEIIIKVKNKKEITREPEEGRCALSELPPRSKTESRRFLRSGQPAVLHSDCDLYSFGTMLLEASIKRKLYRVGLKLQMLHSAPLSINIA